MHPWNFHPWNFHPWNILLDRPTEWSGWRDFTRGAAPSSSSSSADDAVRALADRGEVLLVGPEELVG